MPRLIMAAMLLLFAINPAQAAEPMKVVASFSIIGDLVREIGGDRVAVSVLVGPDADSHAFQPKPADAKKMADARVLVINGLGFEGWMERLAESAGFKGEKIVASKGLKHKLTMKEEAESDHQGHAHGHDGHNDAVDPHAWQDVRNVQLYVANIAAGLGKADPANASYYNEKAATFTDRLRALDQWVRAELGKIPASKRRVITSHDAFGYFARAYDVEFLAPVGYNTEAEPSAADVKRMIDQIRKEGIKALFIENMANPRLIKQIAEETGLQTGGKLYADALSGADGPAAGYEAMIRHNVQTLTGAMQGN